MIGEDFRIHLKKSKKTRKQMNRKTHKKIKRMLQILQMITIKRLKWLKYKILPLIQRRMIKIKNRLPNRIKRRNKHSLKIKIVRIKIRLLRAMTRRQVKIQSMERRKTRLKQKKSLHTKILYMMRKRVILCALMAILNCISSIAVIFKMTWKLSKKRLFL